MRFWLFALIFPGLLSLALTLVQAGTLTEHHPQARDYAGSQDRTYQVYVPNGLGLGPEGQVPETMASPAPLVMVLHGCTHSHCRTCRSFRYQTSP